MAGLLPDIDPDGLLEFSVVFSDRSLNHMSRKFEQVMRDINSALTQVYNAEHTAIVPGCGSFGMEATARQFATNKNVLIVRNGWFSYRWSQIFRACDMPASETVIKATRNRDNIQAPFSPAAVEDVVRQIREQKPDVVFAPHVETSAGMILPDDYLTAIGAAVREHDGLFVLDGIASGCSWVDMKACNVDVLLSATQKGWSSSPAAGIVMLGERALEQMKSTKSTSFCCDLKQWSQVMDGYISGNHVYHTTMPSDALKCFRDNLFEIRDFGFQLAREREVELGSKIRGMLEEADFKSVAAEGFQAPVVVVCFTDDPQMQSGQVFRDAGLQIAAGVPLMCGEGNEYKSFRIGLFGIDKLKDVEGTIQRFKSALDQVVSG